MSGLSVFWIIYTIVMIASGAVFVWLNRKPPSLNLPVPQDSRKYCRDCRWCIPARDVWHRRRDLGHARCAHLTSIREPAEVLVLGSIQESNMQWCELVRKAPYQISTLTREILLPPATESNGMSLCGPEARYWEQR